MAEKNGTAVNPGNRDRRRKVPKPSLALLILGIAFIHGPALPSAASPSVHGPIPPVQKEAPQSLLFQIYEEVTELGARPGESFISWDFHIGAADDDTNQEKHVVVLIYDGLFGTTMAIQITELEPTLRDPNIRYAKTHRTVLCRCQNGLIRIARSDIGERELDGQLRKVLIAVQNKKKLLGIKRFDTPG